MERIVEFGNLSVNQQVDLLEKNLESGNLLLFQFYEQNSENIESQERINEYFENYCDDIIHYYNPKLQVEINQAVLSELIKNVEFLGETDDIRKKEKAKKLFAQMKRGEYTNISEKSMVAIKKLVFYKLVKYNRNNRLYKYIDERRYGKSQWILDERGKVYNEGGAIWYKPSSRKESLDILTRFPLFSCIVLKNGEQIDNFSIGYVVQETASNYDLLIFENN